MGRPAIGRQVVIRLDDDTLERVDALAGHYGRPAFIREAVRRELARRERIASRAASDPIPDSE